MITIGLIDYLNAQPVQYSLRERLASRDVRFVHGVPTDLNRGLLAGVVDLAPVSSIVAARCADRLVAFGGLGIASLGPVRTVLLFSWRANLRDLHGRPVALSQASASSVDLLKRLLAERYGAQPEWRSRPQDLGRMLRECDAALVIGDEALVEGWRARTFVAPDGRTARPTVFDLGDEWHGLTQLPFVFALWAARREALPALDALSIREALAASTDDGLEATDSLAEAHATRLGVPPEVCADYLRHLRYRLNEDDLKGLDAFLERVLGSDRLKLEFDPVLTHLDVGR